jgi:hypothetical protein
VCVPLSIHAGRSLLWHPMIRSQTLDCGSAVEVIHRLGRGVWYCRATCQLTTCIWIDLSKINSVSGRRRRINMFSSCSKTIKIRLFKIENRNIQFFLAKFDLREGPSSVPNNSVTSNVVFGIRALVCRPGQTAGVICSSQLANPGSMNPLPENDGQN